MKNSIILGIFLSIFLISCEEGKDISGINVPSVVVNELKTQFPNMTDLEWKTFGTDYRAEFEMNAVDHKAMISQKGKLLQYKYESSTTDLPEQVKTSIREKYPDLLAEDVHVLKIGNDTFYEVEFERWFGDDYKIFFPSGEENNTMEHWD